MEPKQALAKPDSDQRKKTAWKLVGMMTALEIVGGNISKMLSAEVIRGIERIEHEKYYFELGYERFADYLNSNDCLIGKHAYYDRLQLLNSEGERLYDLLNGLDISLAKRKQIGQGNVEIDGDALIFKETNETVRLSDHKRLLEIIDLTVAANAEKSKKLEKGEEDFRRLKQRLQDAEEKQGTGRVMPALDKVHTVAVGGMAALAAELEKASVADCGSYADGPFSLLVAQVNRINAVLCEKVGIDSIADLAVSGDDEDRLARLLDD